MIALRNELVKEAAAVGSMSGMMVARGEGSSETPRLRILGAASGWGLLPATIRKSKKCNQIIKPRLILARITSQFIPLLFL